MGTDQVNLFDNTANEWYLTGVQIEAGKVATPFEHRSYGEELALCQRYYQHFKQLASYTRVGIGGWGSATTAHVGIHLPVEMRALGSVTFISYGKLLREGINWYAVNSAALSSESNRSFIDVQLGCASSGAAQGDVAWWGSGGGSLEFGLSAEL